MAGFNIWYDYWLPLKQSDPAKYKRLRELAKFKSENTQRTNRLVKIRQSSEFEDLSKNIKKLRETRWQQHLDITDRVKSIKVDNISKLKKDELKSLIKQANTAIKIREEDFITQMEYERGMSFKDILKESNKKSLREYFRRDDYTITDDSTLSELRHTFRMQQLYLSRQNTWEDYNRNLDAFFNKAFKKAGFNEKTALEYRQKYRDKFFKIYKRALEYKNIDTETKGSPIYAMVAEELSKNDNITPEEFVKKLEGGYEDEQQEELEREREEGTDYSVFTGLSPDDYA